MTISSGRLRRDSLAVTCRQHVTGRSLPGHRERLLPHRRVLAQSVEVLKINYEATGAAPPESQVIQEALDGLINQTLLTQEARRRGLWPSADETAAYAQKRKAQLLKLPADSTERQAVELGFGAEGFSIDNMDSDPRSLEILAGELAGIRLANQVEESLPADQQHDVAAAQAALKAFQASLRSQANVVILVNQ